MNVCKNILESNEKSNYLKEIINLRKSINSKYMMKEIFAFLEEKRKLNIMKYNKAYQKLFGVQLGCYVNMSGKFRTGNRNGMGKEFVLSDHILIFEGNYLNGKRHGKGKEYYKRGRKLKFKGNYLNGYRKEGTGYDNSGNIILKLKANDIGKEYYYNGKLKFEGE